MEFYFLLFSLFFPRITMIVSWMFGAYPENSVWLIWDWILGLFIPRLLVLIYIYQNMGYENPWFWTHLIVAIIVYLTGGWGGYRRRNVWWIQRESGEIEEVSFIED